LYYLKTLFGSPSLMVYSLNHLPCLTLAPSPWILPYLLLPETGIL
jgi:hypothetical protein